MLFIFYREENYTIWTRVLIGFGIGAADQTRHPPSNNVLCLEILKIVLFKFFINFYVIKSCVNNNVSMCVLHIFTLLLFKHKLTVFLCRNWKFIHPKKKTFSMRNAKVGKDSLFSKEVLYTLFLTNILSILLGAGVG